MPTNDDADDDAAASNNNNNATTVHHATHVIWTASLAILQRHVRRPGAFVPPLSDRKQLAIGAHRLGTVAKVYLLFEHAFWPPANWTGFTTLWRQQDIVDADPAADPEWWLRHVSGVYRVDAFHPRALCAWLAGPAARHQAALPEAEVRAGLMRLLRRFWRGTDGGADEVPEAVAVLRTRWDREPNVGGSYSYATRRADEVSYVVVVVFPSPVETRVKQREIYST